MLKSEKAGRRMETYQVQEETPLCNCVPNRSRVSALPGKSKTGCALSFLEIGYLENRFAEWSAHLSYLRQFTLSMVLVRLGEL